MERSNSFSEGVQRYLTAYSTKVHLNAQARVHVEITRHARTWAEGVFASLERAAGSSAAQVQALARYVDASAQYLESGAALRSDWEQSRWLNDFAERLNLLVERAIAGFKRCTVCGKWEQHPTPFNPEPDRVGPDGRCDTCAEMQGAMRGEEQGR